MMNHQIDGCSLCRVEVHIKGSLKIESLVSVGSIVDRIAAVGARSVSVCLGQSGLEDLVLGVILGVETGLSASVIAQTEVLNQRQ
jgi:hypothetical protein